MKLEIQKHIASFAKKKENIYVLFDKKLKNIQKCINLNIIFLSLSLVPLVMINVLDNFVLGYIDIIASFASLNIFLFIALDVFKEKVKKDEKIKINKLKELEFEDLKTNNELMKEVSQLIVDEKSKQIFLDMVDKIIHNKVYETMNLFYLLINYKERQVQIHKEEEEKKYKMNNFLDKFGYDEESISKKKLKEKYLEII